ncbi:MAG: PQQ-dependent sugar dehydrogenase [Planctomycetota bacterium]
MRLSCPVLLPVVLAIVAAVAAPRVPAQSLPPDFVAEPIGSDWANPVGFAFVDAASALVAEKAGKLWYVLAGSKSLVLDLRSETLNKGDRGLLDVALDPQFAQNGFVYLLLAVDPNADGLDEEQSTFARLTRYTAAFADGSFTIDPASRVDLLGATWPGGVPSCYLSHTIGMLAFLADGSLVVGAGDGAHHELVDAGGNDPLCFGADRFPGDQDLGAFRAQYMASLAGKILRVDPKSGLGLADNPFFDGDPTSLASRIWALGLRNPFRFALQPGSGPHETLFVGDVGWDAWEEIDVVRGGENFGWPCSEGPVADASYRAADPQGFCARGAFAEPILAWNHSDPGQLGFTGRCTSGVCVYTSGSYPPLCHGGLFFCDLTAGWIKMALLDAYDRVLGVLPFATDAGLPITLRSDPFSGDLVYISLATNQILRLRYVGANQPPVAVVAAAPTVGRPPLLVQFSASSSYDPEGGPLAFLWSFGDGATSTDPDPPHVYTDAGAFTATIELTDVQGKTTAAEIPISTANTPPVITAIDAPLDGSFYQNGVPIELRATASDAEDDLDQKPLDAVWHVDLVEAHHTHPDWVTVTGLSGSVRAAGGRRRWQPLPAPHARGHRQRRRQRVALARHLRRRHQAGRTPRGAERLLAARGAGAERHRPHGIPGQGPGRARVGLG